MSGPVFIAGRGTVVPARSRTGAGRIGGRPPGAAVAAAFVALLCCAAAAAVRASAPVYGYEVVHVYPHDGEAFTQGLIFSDGFIYEGTGRFGESSIRKVELETGLVLKRRDLPEEYFGEGITAFRDSIIQLTWTNYVGFVYVENELFDLVETFPYPWEGWGLTHSEAHLIASDGSSTIRFLDPSTREEISQVQVHDDAVLVDRLNELEYIQGKIYSNVWGSDRIAVIHPGSGAVEAWLDLGGLRDSVASDPDANVLNGIAFDPGQGRLFVTGKLWPKLFEIEVPTLDPSAAQWTETLPHEPPALRIHPNPSVRWASLAFSLPGEAPVPVSLRVFDAEGRLLRTLMDAHRGPGEQAVLLDVGGLPSGAYFAKLAVGDLTAPRILTRRILVVR